MLHIKLSSVLLRKQNIVRLPRVLLAPIPSYNQVGMLQLALSSYTYSLTGKITTYSIQFLVFLNKTSVADGQAGGTPLLVIYH